MTIKAVLTSDERDKFVGDLIDYGTDFVAPLYAVVEAIEQAVLQSPEVQGLRKDAARYRWLREKGRSNGFAVEQETKVWVTTHSAESLDAALDAAMEAKP